MQFVIDVFFPHQFLIIESRQINTVSAVMQELYQTLAVERELSQTAKLSIYQSTYILTLPRWPWAVDSDRKNETARCKWQRWVCRRRMAAWGRPQRWLLWAKLRVEPLLLRVERRQLMLPGRLLLEVRTCPTGRRPQGLLEDSVFLWVGSCCLPSVSCWPWDKCQGTDGCLSYHRTCLYNVERMSETETTGDGQAFLTTLLSDLSRMLVCAQHSVTCHLMLE